MGAPFVHSFVHRFLRPYADHRVLAIGLIAYANAIPALLTASTLAIWLKEFGLSYSAIGLFSLVHLPYNFKFLWAPVLDQIRLPLLTKWLGQRRSWLFLLQTLTISLLLIMAHLNPRTDLIGFIILSVFISIAAASQHVLLLAYQVQTLCTREWGVGEGMSVFGFRMGLLSSGAGGLYLASFLPWGWVYTILASVMGLALLVVLWIPEPKAVHEITYTAGTSPLARIKAWFIQVAWQSYRDFARQESWILVLLFMMIYRLPDHILAPMHSLFFLDIGFTKVEIASVSKVFGLCTTLLGSFVGGLLLRQWSFRETLLFAGVLHGISLVGFLILNQVGHHMPIFITIVAAEHFTSGLGLTAFFSYQFARCNPKFAATQLALMTAAAALGHRIGGLASGFLVDSLGWGGFFGIVLISAVPGIALVFRLPGNVRDPLGSAELSRG